MTDAAPTTVDLWRDALDRTAAAARGMMQAGPKLDAARAYDAGAIARTAFAAMADWTARPQDLMAMQAKAWGEWAEFWTAAWKGEPTGPEIPRSDRRFAGAGWEAQPARTVRDSYLLAARQLKRLAAETGGVDPSAKAMLGFLTDQYLHAVAPTNFALTNPEAMARTVETGGANLVAGFANLLEDLSSGQGIVRRRTDPDAFRKGETIAATRGSVVFQNRLLQLIQYDPETAEVAAEPLLYVPPLVNRFYMIDLQPRSSLVKWLVGQGRTVFVISWVNPGEAHRDCDVAAYVRDGIGVALDEVAKRTDGAKTDLFGFCLGGTLIGVALAWLAAKGEGTRVRSATLLGSMLDFSDMREWSAFVHEAHLDALEKHLEKRGFIDSLELQQLFSAVRANDLVWSAVVNHYLLDKPAPPSDLLYWFEDGARIPEGFLKSYNRELLYHNRLSEPAGFAVDGHALDLGAVRTPVLSVALKDDHVSAWDAVYKGARLLGGPTEFILGGSGHNAGVINPPAANKHGYWRNPTMPESAAEWLEGAEKHGGSWWPAWLEWLDALPAGAKVPARAIDGAIEPAPGSYAMMD